MRVLMNGQAIDELSVEDAKALSILAEREVVEGTVMSVGEAVAAIGRRHRLYLGVMGGVVMAMFFVGFVLAAVYEPRDLAVLAPMGLVLAAGLAALARFVYRRNLARTCAALTPRLARMAAPGALVRVDGAGVSLAGGSLAGFGAAWSDITIEAVELRTIANNDAPDLTIIESLTLSRQGQTMVLDIGGLTNGRAIVDKAWLRLRGVR